MGVNIAKACFVVLLLWAPGSFAIPSSPGDLERSAQEAMAKGQYEKAKRLLAEALDQQPGNPRALYNLACCLSQTGDLKAAARELEAACDAGLRNPELLRSDPDLDKLRASEPGGALIKRLIAEEEEARRLRGKPQFFEAPTLGTVRVVAPHLMEQGRKYPLILILHGHGGRPEPYAGMFDNSEAEIEAIIAAPYGPYPITHQQGHGYSWYTEPWLYQDVLTTGGSTDSRAARHIGLEQTEQAVTGRHVFAAIEAVKQDYPVDEDRVYLVGHSEGGVLAYHLGLNNPDQFRGLVVIGAWLRDSDSSPEILAGAAGRIQVLICHSLQDRQVEFALAKSALKTLKKAGINSKLSEYVGGHGMSAPLIRAIDRWIRDH